MRKYKGGKWLELTEEEVAKYEDDLSKLRTPFNSWLTEFSIVWELRQDYYNNDLQKLYDVNAFLEKQGLPCKSFEDIVAEKAQFKLANPYPDPVEAPEDIDSYISNYDVSLQDEIRGKLNE